MESNTAIPRLIVDMSREFHSKLQFSGTNLFTNLVGEWNLVAKGMDMRPGERIHPVDSL